VPQFVMSNASLLQLLVINLTLVTHAQTPTVMEPRRILEIRSYTLRPETRDYFHRLFIEKSLPLLQQARIDVVGYGASLHDSNSYFLMRSYASIKQRQESEDSYQRRMAERTARCGAGSNCDLHDNGHRSGRSNASRLAKERHGDRFTSVRS
jgi:hypothetical protein